MNTSKTSNGKNDDNDEDQFMDFEEEYWDCSKIKDNTDYWEDNQKINEELISKIKVELENQKLNN